MANLKDIKLKIKSVKNTEKTTKAMKLVSNVKLKKAKDAAVQSSAYAIKINEVLSEIAAKISDNIDATVTYYGKYAVVSQYEKQDKVKKLNTCIYEFKSAT